MKIFLIILVSIVLFYIIFNQIIFYYLPMFYNFMDRKINKYKLERSKVNTCINCGRTLNFSEVTILNEHIQFKCPICNTRNKVNYEVLKDERTDNCITLEKSE